MMDFTKLITFAGPIALAAFGGVMLGGIALSFFWKNFGPWQMLEACRVQCEECHNERLKDARLHADKDASIADLRAQLQLIRRAMESAGLSLMVGNGIEDFHKPAF